MRKPWIVARGSFVFALAALWLSLGVSLPAQHLHAADAPVQDNDYAATIARLQEIVTYEMQDKRLPAFSISLVAGDRIVWSQGFGVADPDSRTPATAETIYRVGSVSKLFTDIAVMQLVESGKLKLDAPIQDYLPDFQPRNPFDVPQTLRQLMSHRSGLVRESPVGHYFDDTEPTLADTIASLNQTTLVYKPGTRTKYSNAGVSVVGYLLEHLSGRPFADYLHEHILIPLELESSSFALTPRIDERLAHANMWTYDGREFPAPKFQLGTLPAGNMYATVNDLGRFLIVLFQDGKTATGQLLKPETLATMLEPQLTEDGKPQSFGIGFHVSDLDGEKMVGHGGAVYGFSTQLEALPGKKLGVAAVAAKDGTNGVVRRITEFALRAMLAERAGNDLPDYPKPSPVPEELARQVAGRYASDDQTIELVERQGRLTLHRGSFHYTLKAMVDGFVIDDALGFGTRIERKNADTLSIGEVEYHRLPDTKPAPAPTEWLGLIGEYGWDHNVLYIYEDRGMLHALIEWFYDYPLTQVSENEFAFPEDYGLYHGERLLFERNPNGVSTEVVAAEVRFVRRAVEPDSGETFKITPVRPVEELRGVAMAAKPPQEVGDFREPQLVELTKLDPSIHLDIRYASTNNFMGAVFYRQPRAFMQQPAAEALVAVHHRLKELGYGLLIHDAYRPWHVTKMFWDATPADLKLFVANPDNGSRHNRGAAVDLTLYDLKSGEPINMVSGYDEFSPRAFPAYPGGTSLARWHRELLRRHMESTGFTVYEFEWWHFDFGDWRKYPILNLTFEDLAVPAE